MTPQRLLLVFGGRSSEHEISLRSATEVLAAVDRTRFEPVLLGIRRDGTWRTGPVDCPLPAIVHEGEVVTDLHSLAPDVVFPVLHGPHGEDGSFQGLLDVLGFAYVGSGVLASALCMDKALCKHVLHHQSPAVPVVPWVECNAAAVHDPSQRQAVIREVATRLGPACFVKPANQGSSVGVSRATDAATLTEALLLAARYDHKIIIEQAIDAREIELAVLGTGDTATIVSMPGEIGLPAGEWYDYDNKYLRDVASLQIPADLEPTLVSRLQAICLQAFRATGCHGLARIDFLVDRQTLRPYLNELNTMPGFTSISMYPKLIGHAGISYTDLITRLCQLATTRQRDHQALQVTRPLT